MQCNYYAQTAAGRGRGASVSEEHRYQRSIHRLGIMNIDNTRIGCSGDTIDGQPKRMKCLSSLSTELDRCASADAHHVRTIMHT